VVELIEGTCGEGFVSVELVAVKKLSFVEEELGDVEGESSRLEEDDEGTRLTLVMVQELCFRRLAMVAAMAGFFCRFSMELFSVVEDVVGDVLLAESLVLLEEGALTSLVGGGSLRLEESGEWHTGFWRLLDWWVGGWP